MNQQLNAVRELKEEHKKTLIVQEPAQEANLSTYVLR